MALVLTVRVGDDFWVGAEQFILEEVLSHKEVVVRRVWDNKIFELNDRKSEEIVPEVMAAVGSRSQLEIARLAVTAPRHIPIGRDPNIAKSGVQKPWSK